MRGSGYAHYVIPSGVVDSDDYVSNSSYITYSYGSPGTEHSSVDVLILTIIGRVATSAYISWGEYNSYGWSSPGTDFHDGAYAIDNRGRFVYDGDSDVDYYSYGALRARICLHVLFILIR